MNKNLINFSMIEDVEIDGIRSWDAPDYSDAFIVSAYHKVEKRPCTEAELDALTESYDFYDYLMDYIH